VNASHIVKKADLMQIFVVHNSGTQPITWTFGKALLYLEIKNSGQTPAYDMITRYTTMILDHPVAANYDFSRPIGANPSRAVLNPSACIRSESEPHPLSASEVEEIKDPNGKRRLYTFGEIKYRDAFNTGRHTHFCFYNEWGGETLVGQVSEHYNDAD
jgi:hypothetical protein